MNYYELLQVSENADKDEIKKSYKKLVKKYHPDIYEGDKSFAEKKIKELNEAYEILSDDSSKAEYDRILKSIRDDTQKIFENDNNISDITNQTSFYQAENLEKRYNEMYNYDYYKKYTTNYYGVDKSHEKNKYTSDDNITDSVIKKFKNFVDENIQNTRTIVIICILSLLLIIALLYAITLLSKVKDLLGSSNGIILEESNNTYTNYNYYTDYNYNYTNDYDNTYNDDLENTLEEYYESILSGLDGNFDGIVKKGCSIYNIIDYYGKPDKYYEDGDYTIAYYQDSYIIYNVYGIVVDFKNNGFFLSENVIQGDYNSY